ncbi:tRNA pseudouridine(13) synthase [Vibrio crassostreae]|uniref:tRNA pseudouridine(13) synthase TruD n=1 Tax=Vibrio crassostreae TaxID=246167 RepID=UPI000F49DD6D|nr:tRNA pseudouridine(13) synthase TruD [Vibrio crassostreae]NOH75836.1 tRNA pseudouridine(13) synthase TruD [Vibrio crassostreae]ROR17700.1 TruD family tRNA pseudouridine synthase [Vibrio crassostreae]CAK1915340.1 tRNA pseudouridine(13) synthase [Vibrio crassostreae]CAK2308585.1 tRNA pseudouridine(13) synthase [Vibrio crassostreae]CAK2325392.1 tRNA pseudouridine(13) synthase [Vibrio crassostreae]
MSDILSSLAYLNGKPTAKAKLKAKAEHFVVNEDLGFEFTGEGEHLMVRIRKTGENTSFVANELAKACGVKSKDVSWAGLKDRHAVTEQWLSVHLPKGEPDFSAFLAQYPSIEILATARHNKKLRPGDLVGNQFELTLSEVTDCEDVVKRLEKVAQVGVPNYFGAQRFGNEGNNLSEARRWGRDNVRTRNQNKRSLYLSAARSWIYNLILSDRIEQDAFASTLVGDIVVKDGAQLTVTADNIEAVNQDIANGSALMTVALAGDNALPTTDESQALEQKHLDAEPDLMALIRGNRMRHDRREASLKPTDLTWEVNEDNVTLKFSLDAGCFATAIVRELVEEVHVERSYEQ